MSSSTGRIVPYTMENKKCLKPPTSIYWMVADLSIGGMTTNAGGHPTTYEVKLCLVYL